MNKLWRAAHIVILVAVCATLGLWVTQAIAQTIPPPTAGSADPGVSIPSDLQGLMKLLTGVGSPSALAVLAFIILKLVKAVPAACEAVKGVFTQQQDAHKELVKLGTDSAKELAGIYQQANAETAKTLRTTLEASQAASTALNATMLQARELLREANETLERAKST